MLKANIPAKWAEVWAQNTPGSNIRTIPQTTSGAGFASQDQGFPPANAIPVASGGIPPFIQDTNGALQYLSQWVQWLQGGGGLVPWDSTFGGNVGGYFNGAIVLSATTPGAYYVSTADNNTTNPDAGGGGWVPGSLYGSFTTGGVMFTVANVAPVGWVAMNDGSIGNAASGATTRNNADTQPLFSMIFNNITDAWAPLQNSSGATIPRSTYATPALAFAANSRILLPLALGRVLGAAGSGAGLGGRALGQYEGQQTYTLVNANLPPIFSSANENVIVGSGGADAVNAGGTTIGSSTPFAIMQPTTYLTALMKL